MHEADLIAAIATAPGRGGIGIVRVSGPNIDALMAGILGKIIAPRQAVFSRFLDASGQPLDEGVALYFPAPHSYTGEAVLELQGHGGPVVLSQVLARCLELGARLAEPGEFTRRAFLNDKLDLAQAEAVADLIDAASSQAAKSALRALQGAFSRQVHAIVDKLIRLRMLVEATLDFPEEDVDYLAAADAMGQLARIRDRLAQLLVQAKQGAVLRNGLNIVLFGAPNVGKSSLLNQLAGHEAAIVTPVAGTTRDAISQDVELGGVLFRFIDTAGIRETDDLVEQMGIARTRTAIEQADLGLLLLDASKPEDAQLADLQLPVGLPTWKVFNKADLLQSIPDRPNALYLSAKTGEKVDALRERLIAFAGVQDLGEGAFIARERHVQALKAAQERLELAAMHLHQIELFAEELRLAQRALGEITGDFSADDLLGEIFSRFCIGK